MMERGFGLKGVVQAAVQEKLAHRTAFGAVVVVVVVV
jgi:hypothetical protein